MICGDKEIGFLPCIFGTLKAGRAYVPIDSIVSRNRVSQIAADVKPRIIVDFTGGEFACEARILGPADVETIFPDQR